MSAAGAVMERSEVLRLVREAGLMPATDYLVSDRDVLALERFAALVAAAEREACAKLLDVVVVGDEYTTSVLNSYADDIRARAAK